MKHIYVQQLIQSARQAALAIAKTLPQSTELQQAELYEWFLVDLMCESVGHMSTAELLLAPRAVDGPDL